MTTALVDTAVTPAMLLDEVRRHRASIAAAEARIMQVAVEWAHAHPVTGGGEGWRVQAPMPLAELDGSVMDLDIEDPESEELVGWCGIPPVAWDAPAQFAAANQMSTTAGKKLLRDALILHHRLPRTWARVSSGQVPAWRGRRIAEAVLGAPSDVVSYLDTTLAPIAGTIGTVTLDRTVEEAMLLLHAETREIDQANATDAHEVRFHADAQPDGSADLHAHGDWKDLHDLDQTIAKVAAALKANGDDNPLGARRARALGVLADPAGALALLAGDVSPSADKPSKQAVLHLHITDLGLLGLDPVGINDKTGHAVLVQQVRDWLARTDTHVTVKPVLDLQADLHTEAYAIPDTLREQTILTHSTCVFPWCTRPSRRCDLDHIHAWDPASDGGRTCSANLAPLCRHHHRLKTHAGWTYRRLDTRVFLWTDPHGFHYRRDRGGTSVVNQT